MELDKIYNSLLRGDLTLVYQFRREINELLETLLNKEFIANQRNMS